MSAPALPGPCPRCTGLGDAHYLTCPTLRLGVVTAPPGHWLNLPPDSEEFQRHFWGAHYGQPGEPGEAPVPP